MSTSAATAAAAFAGVAAAGRLAASEHAVDDRGGAANAGIHTDGASLAVERAGATLHAAVDVGDAGAPVLNDKDLVRANLHAHAAAGALAGIVIQRGGSGKIFHKIPHPVSLKAMSSRTLPASAAI